MTMCDQGFIKLSRKYFKSFMWKESRVYSRAEAWLDLIFQARFEASTELINGRVIEVMRGEIPASRRFLEERWKWGSSKVSNFIELLVKQEMINQRVDQGQTVYLLCKYDTYNDSQTTDEPQSEPVTNDETNHDEIKTGAKPNQRHDQEQTTELQYDSDSYDEMQTSNKPANKPQTNQRQTTDKPRTNQSKEYKKERIKEDNNNTPLIPQIDDSSNLPVDEIIQPKKGKEKSSAKKERKVFSIPSLNDVTDYCKQNGYTISPWKFVNYYTSNGWMVGKNKMQDWQAAVRTWQAKEHENGSKNSSIPVVTGNNKTIRETTDFSQKDYSGGF